MNYLNNICINIYQIISNFSSFVGIGIIIKIPSIKLNYDSNLKYKLIIDICNKISKNNFKEKKVKIEENRNTYYKNYENYVNSLKKNKVNNFVNINDNSDWGWFIDIDKYN